MYGMEIITTEEGMDKLGMFRSIFGKIDEFFWWNLGRILVDAGMQFTSIELQNECQTHSVWLMLVAPEHQKFIGQVEGTWRILCTITHSRMVHARVFEAYILSMLIYTADHIFPVLPIKALINEDSKPTTPFKLVTGTKPSISSLCVLLFCV